MATNDTNSITTQKRTQVSVNMFLKLNIYIDKNVTECVYNYMKNCFFFHLPFLPLHCSIDTQCGYSYVC